MVNIVVQVQEKESVLNNQDKHTVAADENISSAAAEDQWSYFHIP